MKATVDKFGRIVIPKQIRDALDLEPGTELAIDSDQRRVVLEPVRDEPEVVDREGVLVVESGALEPLHQALERSAGSWKDRTFSGADYVDRLRGDLRERLRRLEME